MKYLHDSLVAEKDVGFWLTCYNRANGNLRLEHLTTFLWLTFAGHLFKFKH